jgi:hypothetical protein
MVDIFKIWGGKVKRYKTLQEIRESMKREEDYMSMKLPRKFSNTLEEIYKVE